MDDHSNHTSKASKSNAHYIRLVLMTSLSFAAMYALMYAMVNNAQNVRMNLNQFYMAGLMTAAMVVIELAVMSAMYAKHNLNLLILGVSLSALIAFWFLIRAQTAISNEQFLKSMIPHHAGAILMCEQASITKPEIEQLCRSIVSSQTAEIKQMKAMLGEVRK